MDAEACKQAFIKAGFWPNEVMWSAWQQAWEAATLAERKACELRCAKTEVLLPGHHEYTALNVQTMMMDAVSTRSNAELSGPRPLAAEGSRSNAGLCSGG